MRRTVRYQGAIVRNDHILLIKHCEHATGRAYWVIPGGGRESGETEETCVKREMLEETHLEVTIERLLLEENAAAESGYQYFKTYLCRVSGGEERPGYEPEIEAAGLYAITEVGWFDLCDPGQWPAEMKADRFTFPLVQQMRAILGYPVARSRLAA